MRPTGPPQKRSIHVARFYKTPLSATEAIWDTLPWPPAAGQAGLPSFGLQQTFYLGSFGNNGQPAPSQRYQNSSPMKPGKPGSSTRLRRTWQTSGMMARWVTIADPSLLYLQQALSIPLTYHFLPKKVKTSRMQKRLQQAAQSNMLFRIWSKPLASWKQQLSPAASGGISTTPPEPSVRSFPCCKGTSQFQGTQRPHKNMD